MGALSFLKHPSECSYKSRLNGVPIAAIGMPNSHETGNSGFVDTGGQMSQFPGISVELEFSTVYSDPVDDQLKFELPHLKAL